MAAFPHGQSSNSCPPFKRSPHRDRRPQNPYIDRENNTPTAGPGQPQKPRGRRGHRGGSRRPQNSTPSSKPSSAIGHQKPKPAIVPAEHHHHHHHHSHRQKQGGRIHSNRSAHKQERVPPAWPPRDLEGDVIMADACTAGHASSSQSSGTAPRASRAKITGRSFIATPSGYAPSHDFFITGWSPNEPISLLLGYIEQYLRQQQACSRGCSPENNNNNNNNNHYRHVVQVCLTSASTVIAQLAVFVAGVIQLRCCRDLSSSQAGAVSRCLRPVPNTRFRRAFHSIFSFG